MTYTVAFLIAASVAAPALIFWWALLRRGVSPARLVVLLIIIGATCRLAFALGTPTFYAPDEQSHFNYVRYLYEQRAFPVQLSRTNAPSNDWEYYQPPLYYLLCLPLYALSAGVFHAPAAMTVLLLRLFSIACWAVTLAFALRLLKCLRLEDAAVGCTLAAMLACLPTYAFIGASVNNDNLVAAIGAVFLYTLAGKSTARAAVLLGLLLGLATLAKLTAIVYGFALAALLVVRYLRGSLGIGRALMLGGISSTIAAVLWLPWGRRNLAVYGDLTGESRANVRFEWSSAGYALRTIATYLSESFWSVSGIYNNVEFLPQLGIAFGILASAGLLLRLVGSSRDPLAIGEGSRQFLAAMAATIALAVVLVTRFGYLYNQGQGRLLFPLLIPLALLLGLGIQALALPAHRPRVPGLVAAFFSTYLLAYVAYSLAVFRV